MLNKDKLAANYIYNELQRLIERVNEIEKKIDSFSNTPKEEKIKRPRKNKLTEQTELNQQLDV